jgi:hypothetical protein
MTKLASLQWAGLALGVAGCSFIYNPDHINRSDDALVADAEIIADSDPTMLHLDSLAPALFYEGQGGTGLIGSTPFGGPSRQTVLVISGTQIVKDQTSVAITVHAGEMKNPMVIVDNTMLDVAADGDMLAVPVTIPVDPTLGAADLVRFDVTVTQNTVNGPYSQTLSETADHKPILQVQGLDELKGVNAVIVPSNPQAMYSYVDLTGTISAPAGQTVPLILRAATSISIGGALIFDAVNGTPGVAGGTGGAPGPGGVVSGEGGGPGGGPNGGGTSGQPGKYKGTDQLGLLGGMNLSSGGAGGDGSGLLTGSAGGAGGGGGGAVEITAGTDLKLATVSAKGASGLTGANNGGAGTGGVVLLRSGGSATVTSVNVSQGAALAGADPGRVRIDAPNTITASTSPGMYYRGPSFVTSTPMIVRSENAMVTIISQTQRNVIYYINNADGSQSHGPVTVLSPPNGIVPVTLDAKLFRGLNSLCAIVDGGSAGDQAGQCIQIAYLYSP